MASVRKKGDKWEVRYYTADALGRMARRSKMVAGTRKAALAHGAMLEGGLVKSRAATGRTVEQAALAWVAKGGRRSSDESQRAVAYRVQNYIAPHIGSVRIDAVTPETIEGLYFRLCQLGLGDGTVQNVHWDLSGTFKMAARYGWIEDNPMERVERKPYQAPEAEPPPVAEIERMLAVVDEAALRSFAAAGLAIAIRIAIATGARRGELCRLTWGDIDLDRGFVRIMSTKTMTRRVIGVDETVVARLRDHRARLEAMGLGVGPSDTVMHKDDRQPITPNALGSRFQLYRKMAGVTYSLHDLRHFTASVWLTVMKPVEASRAIGHRRVSTTTDTYGHVLDEVEIDRRPAAAIAARVRL